MRWQVIQEFRFPRQPGINFTTLFQKNGPSCYPGWAACILVGDLLARALEHDEHDDGGQEQFLVRFAEL